MISLEEVRAQILERIAPLEASEIGLEEAAGRTLAEDVSSADPIPPFDNSAMDGFALRRADLERAAEEAPRALRVVFRVEAGSEPARAIGAGEAARITTGAPLPPGADCIVPFERAAAFDDDSVTVAFLPASGAHVRRLGEEIAAGDIVLQRGTRLTPAAVGLLATVGRQAASYLAERAS
ncbi:MAG: molybdopterin molybdenumtransferase MoeA, partial [Planctomycetota bacterium]